MGRKHMDAGRTGGALMALPLEWKRDPDIAQARKDLADVYRNVRKRSAPIARLLYRRYRLAYKLLAADLQHEIYVGGTGSGGLAELIA